MDSPLVTTPSPHIHCGSSTTGIMLDVIIALVPASVVSVLLFGWRAALVIAVCVGTCVITEVLCRLAMRRTQTVGDLSAAVTGILLAFCLPPSIPIWQAVFGSVFAIAIVKQLFGGIGQNFINPALAARLVLTISFPTDMSDWTMPLSRVTDAMSEATSAATSGATSVVSTATPLANPSGYGSMLDLFLGIIPGTIGEVCAAALLAGGVYLLVRKVITPTIPVVFMLTVAVISFFAGENPLFQLMTGGIMLGAIFMATDYSTSPLNTTGKIIFAVGGGAITMLLRLVPGGFPEGVSIAIVFMNCLVPLIERAAQLPPFGYKGAKKA